MLKKILYWVVRSGRGDALLAFALRPKPLEVEAAAVAPRPLPSGRRRGRQDPGPRALHGLDADGRHARPHRAARRRSRRARHRGGAAAAAAEPAARSPRPRDRRAAAGLDARTPTARPRPPWCDGGRRAQLAQSTLARDRDLVAQSAATQQQLEQDEADARMQASELESLRFAEKVAAHAVDEARLALGSFSAKAGSRRKPALPADGRRP